MTVDESLALVYSDAPPHAPLVVEETLTPGGMLMRCEQLHSADKAAEKQKSRFALLGGLSLGAAFLCLFLAAVSETVEVFIGTGVFGALGIVLFIVRGILGRADVDDRKLHVASKIVDVLCPDLHKKRPVKLWMDFAGYDKSPRASKVSFFRRSGTKLFVKPWLRMSFVLLDGTEVALHARSTCKRKEKAKRKYTKIKDTVVDELEVFVKPPKSVSLAPVATDRAKAVLQSRSPLGPPKGLKVKPRVLSASFRLGPGRRFRGRSGWTSTNLERLLDGDKAVAAVLLGYRAMRAARQS